MADGSELSRPAAAVSEKSVPEVKNSVKTPYVGHFSPQFSFTLVSAKGTVVLAVGCPIG
jgi:hypothetical protein